MNMLHGRLIVEPADKDVAAPAERWDVDLAIIGSGSAAFAAAIRATEAGARVVKIEKDRPGETS